MVGTLKRCVAVALFVAAASLSARANGPDGSLASRAFERLKALEGAWTARSTKGWTASITYRTIADGSCVMEMSSGAHENDTMATMFYLDGDRLLLTHYCSAKNQPRLMATDIAPDLSTITFTFLDATNLPSRDTGHMDKVVLRLRGDDAFSSQWTWYHDGAESWMEEIVHERRRPAGRNGAEGAATGLGAIAWIAGDWGATDDKGGYEEHWTAPGAGAMTGMFRWAADGKVRVHEFMMLEEAADGVTLRIRHFGAGMTPREDSPLVFRMTGSGDRSATFVQQNADPPARLVYESPEPDTLRITLIKVRDGKETETPFTMRRGR